MNGRKPRILSFVEGRASAVQSPSPASQKSLKTQNFEYHCLGVSIAFE
jgi:hypothetical protein